MKLFITAYKSANLTALRGEAPEVALLILIAGCGGDPANPDSAAGSGGSVNSVGAGGSGGAGGSTCAPPEHVPTTADPAATAPEPDPELAGQVHHYFQIKVVDAATSAPLAGAKLQTTNKIVLTSDDHGVVAFYEPGLMGEDVWFSISHPGYEVAADFLGSRGKALRTDEGGSAELRLTKTSGQTVSGQGDLASRLVTGPVPGRDACLAIRVVDRDNKRGVPLVRLTAFGEDSWSDSQGMIAYCHPDHLDTDVTFDFFTHGYALAAGGSTVNLATPRGGSAEVELTRTQVAERLYRITGAGGYRDSLLLGLKTPLIHPALNGKVMGSDTGSTAIYRGKLFWLWQDTDQVAYPLGNFRGTAATSELPGNGGLSPDLGANFDYFVGDNGFAAPMCEAFEPGNAPVWMGGPVSLLDASGTERLFAGYVKVAGDGSPIESGVARFDDEAKIFKRVVKDFAGLGAAFARPDGHAFRVHHEQGEYVYYSHTLRIPTTAEAIVDRSQYEQFTPYGGPDGTEIERNADGTLKYAWRPGALHPNRDALLAAGVNADQALEDQVRDVGTGEGVKIAGESYAWNPYRKRFFMIAQRVGSRTSFLGNLVHVEGDTPVGPWVYAREVLEHNQYTFYNSFHHPEFDRDGGRVIYVEGTYTESYSGAPAITPRYNYNQVMYRVDLDDPRLVLPVPIYDRGTSVPGDFTSKKGIRRGTPSVFAPFFANDRPSAGTVAVAWSGPSCGPRQLVVGGTPPTAPLFYALPPGTTPAPPSTVPLYEYRHGDGRRAYSVDAAAPLDGFTRVEEPIALVWENPIHVALPVSDYLGDLVANAGEDQCVSADGDTASVALDGSASSALVGAITSYRWRIESDGTCQSLDGAQVAVTLPKGEHSVELEVTDDHGNVSVDTVLVSVS